MKKIGLLCLLALGAMAQQKEIKKTSEMRIRVEKDENGKKQVTERVIDTSKMSDTEREKFVAQIQDSLMAGKDKNGRMKISIDSESSDMKNFNWNENTDERGNKQVIIKRFSDKHKPMGELEKEIQVTVDAQDMDSPHIVMKRLGENKMVFISNEGEKGKSASVHGIKAYPNNPNNEVLNVRFNAPEKGNVSISVMDTAGKTIAKEEIKDFSGEYVGQLKVGKQKGTFFVMVVQNGDGNVKRVTIE